MSDPQPRPRIPLTERLTGAALMLPVTLSRALPYRWRVPLAGWLTSRVLGPLAGYSRRVRENLALVRPDLPGPEMARITRGVTDNAGRNMMELFSPEFTARHRDVPTRGPGIEVLRRARAENRPAVIVSAHLASFNAARVGILKEGIELACFYRAMANRPFNARYVAAMARVSAPIFEQSRAGVAQMVRHLRKGGMVGILADINAHDGVPLEFFGKPALTTLSPAEMALKYNAPLVPVFATRQPDGLGFEVIFEAEIPPSDPVTMMRDYNRRLEAMVRANMDQWFWIHRRWKDGATALGQKRAQELETLERQVAGEGQARPP
jgi:KDO2-lipid IV(A) lauroyltransferase